MLVDDTLSWVDAHACGTDVMVRTSTDCQELSSSLDLKLTKSRTLLGNYLLRSLNSVLVDWAQTPVELDTIEPQPVTFSAQRDAAIWIGSLLRQGQ